MHITASNGRRTISAHEAKWKARSRDDNWEGSGLSLCNHSTPMTIQTLKLTNESSTPYVFISFSHFLLRLSDYPDSGVTVPRLNASK